MGCVLCNLRSYTCGYRARLETITEAIFFCIFQQGHGFVPSRRRPVGCTVPVSHHLAAAFFLSSLCTRLPSRSYPSMETDKQHAQQVVANDVHNLEDDPVRKLNETTPATSASKLTTHPAEATTNRRGKAVFRLIIRCRVGVFMSKWLTDGNDRRATSMIRPRTSEICAVLDEGRS